MAASPFTAIEIARGEEERYIQKKNSREAEEPGESAHMRFQHTRPEDTCC